MSPARSSPDTEERVEEGDSLSTLSELEGQRKEAGDIVYRWFRFRVRRGIGVFYCLLSFLPVIGSIMGTLFASQFVGVAGASVALVCSWAVSRNAGFRGFGRMSSTLDLLKGDGSPEGRRWGTVQTFVAITLWPWLAYGIAGILGLRALQILFAVLWLVEYVAYRFLTLSRNRNPLVDHRAEDWLVVVIIPVAALISAAGVLASAPPFYAFLMVSPILLFCGMKSLYDAPKELVMDIGSPPR